MLGGISKGVGTLVNSLTNIVCKTSTTKFLGWNIKQGCSINNNTIGNLASRNSRRYAINQKNVVKIDQPKWV